MTPGDQVYLPMCLDYIHIGHINILNHALATGATRITIGLVTDELMDQYKKRHHTYSQRWELAYALKGVTNITKEGTQPLFIDTIMKLQPEYVIHGDDWSKKEAPLFHIRNMVRRIVRQYGGIVIEPPYTEGVNSTKIRDEYSYNAGNGL